MTKPANGTTPTTPRKDSGEGGYTAFAEGSTPESRAAHLAKEEEEVARIVAKRAARAESGEGGYQHATAEQAKQATEKFRQMGLLLRPDEKPPQSKT